MVVESTVGYVSSQSIQPVTENLTTYSNLNLYSFTSETVPDNEDPHEEIVRMMQVIGRLPIIVLGTIGNLLTFITMQRGSLRNLSTCFYMAILSLSDTGRFIPMMDIRVTIKSRYKKYDFRLSSLCNPVPYQVLEEDLHDDIKKM